MNTDRLRSLFAWAFGIITSIAVFYALTKMSSEMGLETYVGSDDVITWDSGSYTNDGEGYSTTLGISITIISITIGARFGMALFAKRWDGGSEKKGILSLSLFMIGVTVYAALLTTLWKTIPSVMLEYGGVGTGAEIAVVAGLYWLLNRIYRAKLYAWQHAEENRPMSPGVLPKQNDVVSASPKEEPAAVEAVAVEPVAEVALEKNDKVDLNFLNALIAKSTETSSTQAPFVLKEEKPLKKRKTGSKNNRKEKQANRKSKSRKQTKNLETETRLYVVRTPFSEPNGNVVIKIGESTNIEERIKTFRFYWRDKFKILAMAPGRVKDEAEFHRILLSKHIGGEYFSVNPDQIPAASPMMSKQTLLKWLGEILHED